MSCISCFYLSADQPIVLYARLQQYGALNVAVWSKYVAELPSISTWDCHTYHGSHYWTVCKVCDVRYYWLILRTRLAQLFSRSCSSWCAAVQWLPVPVPTSSWWSWWTPANIYPTSTSSARYMHDLLWSLYLLSDEAPCELLEYHQHAHHHSYFTSGSLRPWNKVGL